MMILTTLSRHTSNSWNDLIKLPMHLVLGLFNTLKAQFDEEKKQQEKAEKEKTSSMPRMPSSISLPSTGNIKVPSMPRF